ncbi:MFS transporter [Deinococcus koreensis]|uniref:MFS transporter n=1 Tax=Deinococcus koreensis TaxID=2054903 RepID=A0A2K3UWM0_9DEIO|nr:MFS transporter [Deinococcus koreensis]PNY80933.1 MFS transporter [Deinococcus koreensis]
MLRRHPERLRQHGAAVWALAGLSTVGYGALYYAQPLLALATEQERGWTRLHTSSAFTGALLVTALAAPLVGRRLDRRGGRSLLGGGALLGALALAALTMHLPFGLFLAAWALAGLAMALSFYEATFTVLRQALPPERRSAATLTVTLVAGLASTVFVPLTMWLLGRVGLDGALLGLSGLLALAGMACWLALPAGAPLRPGSPPPSPPPVQDAAALHAPGATFQRLALAFTAARIASVGVGLQLVPALLAAGHAPALAAALTGLMGLAALPGRLLFLPLLRRLGSGPLTAALLLAMAGAAALLGSQPSGPDTAPWAPAALGILVFGMANGALTLARAELLAQHFPPEQFGTVNGRLARPVNLAQAFTPLGMGALFSLSGDYHAPLLLCAGLAGWAAWTLRPVRRPTLATAPAE